MLATLAVLRCFCAYINNNILANKAYGATSGGDGVAAASARKQRAYGCWYVTWAVSTYM